ncbi:MAG: FmdB family zinc ribbon protein [Nitriliruptorales bacterium]|nr:FmdB family zinc ribbon protein [Nitriliruptorales bacterium]
MPLYEYVCRDCGSTVERILSHDEADTPGACPECDGDLDRRFSRVAVKLEGWGFSKTDGWVPDRPGGRPDFQTVKERAERLSDGEGP